MNLEILNNNKGTTKTKLVFIILGILLVIIVIGIVGVIIKQNEKKILDVVSECVKDTLNNNEVKWNLFGGEIVEVRYIKDNNTIITLIKTSTADEQEIHSYKDTEIYGTISTTDITYEYTDTEDDKVSTQKREEIVKWWQEAQKIDIEKVID